MEQQEGKLFNKISRGEDLDRAREEYNNQELREKQWMKEHQEEFKKGF
ncbi:MAG: hypothetical protein HY922_15730 [Elusimicrobia bacterium]|nr:hypothetical protein [Elusimicrobiota bacterium]